MIILLSCGKNKMGIADLYLAYIHLLHCITIYFIA